MNEYEQLKYALKNTKILKQTRLYISTFLSTELPYYVLTEAPDRETELRRGKVLVEKPMIITPHYLAESHFEGFGEDQMEYLKQMMQHPAFRGLDYQFKNVDSKVDLIEKEFKDVVEMVSKEIERENKYAGVIHGIMGMWSVSLMKYILGIIGKSFPGNIEELEDRGFI